MVRVQYLRTGTGCYLEISGHAGAAPEGKDLVCSAVSILMYTAAQRALELYSAGMLQQWPLFELEIGKSYVAVDARRKNVLKVQMAMDTVLTGLQLLAKQYPQYVTFDQSQNRD